jgi:hypothetical protein
MVVVLPYSSAILDGIDTTDLLIYKVRQYLSSFGNFAVILLISKQSSYGFCQTLNSMEFVGFSLDPLNPARRFFSGRDPLYPLGPHLFNWR